MAAAAEATATNPMRPKISILAGFEQRKPVTGPGSATAAVDDREAEDTRLRLAAEEAERKRIEDIARHQRFVRRACVMNLVTVAAQQAGRFFASAADAWACEQMFVIADAVYAEQAPAETALPSDKSTMAGIIPLQVKAVEEALRASATAPAAPAETQAAPAAANEETTLGADAP
jgi:hypothetical protein